MLLGRASLVRGGRGDGRRAGGRLTRLLCVTVCSLAIFGAAAAAAQAACTDTWTGARSNVWGDAGNWSAGHVPGGPNATEDVCLPSGAANYPVQLTYWTYTDPPSGATSGRGNTLIGDLTIASGAGLVIHGQSYVDRGVGGQQMALTMSGTGTIAAGGSLELLASDDGSGTPESTHGGSAMINGTGSLTNAGSFSSVSTTTQATANDGTFHNQLDVSLLDQPGSSGEVTSGFLDVNSGSTLTNQSQWSVDPGAWMNVVHNGLQTGPTTFANQGSYVNAGTTVVGGTGLHNEDPDVFAQSGPESGNPVQLKIASKLSDAAGTGSFLFNSQNGQLAGTIPPGQTVTVEADLYNTNTYLNELTLAGNVTNQGTFVVHTPNVSTDTNTGVRLLGSQLVNQGIVDLASEAPHLINELDIPVTNQHGGSINVQSGTTWFTGGQVVTNDGTLAIAPGANAAVNSNQFLTGKETFVNAADGTIAPQLAGGATGTLTFGHYAVITLGGTAAPQLVGGYAPALGTEVQAFPIITDGVTINGTFAGVANGFTADYSHATGDSPNYIGLVYGGQAATPPPKTGATKTLSTPSVKKPTVKGSTVKLVLSCPKGNGCAKATVKATVTEKVKVKVKTGKGKKAKTKTTIKTEKVVVASTSVTLKSGAHKTVTLTLNKTGKKLLAKAHRLALAITVSTGGKVRKTYKVTVSTKVAKKKAAPKKTHKR